MSESPVDRQALARVLAAEQRKAAIFWAISYDGKTPYKLWDYGDGDLLDAEIKRQGGTAQKMALCVCKHD